MFKIKMYQYLTILINQMGHVKLLEIMHLRLLVSFMPVILSEQELYTE